MKLYEINGAIESLIDTETGEIKDADALHNLQMSRNDKIHNIAAYIVNLKSDAEQAEARAKVFAERAKHARNKAASLEAYLQSQLGGAKWKDDDFTVTFRKSVATEIYDEDAIPIDYKTYSQPKVNKMALLKALKAGQPIKGAQLVERVSMTVK